jgi:phosphatidylglycerol:prolipoprotein diacylglycerol transferase
MYPRFPGGLDSIFLVWGYAALIGVVIGVRFATRDGHALGRVVAALALIGVVFVAGTKVHFWAANPELINRTGLLLSYGFHIPGGIIATALLGPLALRALGVRPLEFFDSIAPATAFSIAVARLGCFANGCCFGYVSGRPWAIAFPAGSRAHEHHVRVGLIPADAAASLPVLPLSLWFSAVALAIGVVLVAWRRRRRFAGQLSLALVALWSLTNVVIELCRDPRMVPGTPRLWGVSLAVAALSVPALIALSVRCRAQRVPLPPLSLSPAKPRVQIARAASP